MRIKIVFLLMMLTQSVYGSDTSAEVDAAAVKIRSNLPANIELVSVERQGDGLTVRGDAASNADIAVFMRYLDKEVGSPTLESAQRNNSRSEFILIIKKLR